MCGLVVMFEDFLLIESTKELFYEENESFRTVENRFKSLKLTKRLLMLLCASTTY